MHLIYRKEELAKANGQLGMPEPEVTRPLWQNALFFFVMVGVLVFANWGTPNDWRFKLTDGTEFRAAITKAPEDAAAAGAAYRVKMLEGAGRRARKSQSRRVRYRAEDAAAGRLDDDLAEQVAGDGRVRGGVLADPDLLVRRQVVEGRPGGHSTGGAGAGSADAAARGC